MHFFYGINNNFFKSEIQIPTFKNRHFSDKNNYTLCKCSIKDNKWYFENLINKKVKNKFFILKNEDFSDENFFFLLNEKNFHQLNENKLKEFEKFAVRANLKIYLENGGFSSYQSEYPYGMVEKRGNIISSIGSLSNIDTQDNYMLFRNIVESPIKEKFKAYLVNLRSKSKIHEFELVTNTTNIFKIDKNFIKPEVYFISDKYLGIPSFVSVKNGHISFEHTHPPHAYILNPSKFYLVKKLKDKINEIIY